MSYFRNLPERLGVAVLLALSVCGKDLSADDKIFRKGSDTPATGTILKVDETSVHISLPGGVGSTAIQRAEIERVEVTMPAAVQTGAKAALDGKADEAIKLLEPLYIQYRGLPQGWIEEMSIRLGEAYLAKKDWPKAGVLFTGFEKFYPNSDFRDAAISGEAECAFRLNKPEDATKLLERMVSEREKELAVTDEQSRALGRACVTLGRCLMATNKQDAALEAFLKTTVLYYKDPVAVSEALYESSMIFEKMNNLDRARGQLEDLLKEAPHSPLAAEAQKKLETLKPAPKS